MIFCFIEEIIAFFVHSVNTFSVLSKSSKLNQAIHLKGIKYFYMIHTIFM